jgi:hypothetical protein
MTIKAGALAFLISLLGFAAGCACSCHEEMILDEIKELKYKVKQIEQRIDLDTTIARVGHNANK